MASGPFSFGFQARLVAVQLLQLLWPSSGSGGSGDVHGTGPLALGAAGAASGQVHGADDVPGGVAGRPGRALHRLRAVLSHRHCSQ